MTLYQYLSPITIHWAKWCRHPSAYGMPNPSSRLPVCNGGFNSPNNMEIRCACLLQPSPQTVTIYFYQFNIVYILGELVKCDLNSYFELKNCLVVKKTAS